MGFYVNDSKGFREILEFDDAVQKLKDSYEYMAQRVEDMRETLASWNKDEEIQKWKKQAEDNSKYSLCHLSPKEYEAKKAFIRKHYEECAVPLNSKIAGSTYIYELTGTGIGTCIKITCPICGQSEDITDIDSW